MQLSEIMVRNMGSHKSNCACHNMHWHNGAKINDSKEKINIYLWKQREIQKISFSFAILIYWLVFGWNVPQMWFTFVKCCIIDRRLVYEMEFCWEQEGESVWTTRKLKERKRNRVKLYARVCCHMDVEKRLFVQVIDIWSGCKHTFLHFFLS